jgi:tetratricopeptide (TPR) repeat protein
VTVLGAAALHGPISRGWNQFTHSGNPTGSTARFTSLGGDRYAYWRAAYHAFESDPGRGIGPGSFEFYWSRHGTTSQVILIRNPHSLYLQKLAELGLAGLAAIVVAIAGLLWGAIEARRRWIGESDLAAGAGLLAAFVVFAVYAGVDWMWEMGAIGTLAMGGAAVVGAGGFRRAAPLGGWARAGLAVAALVAAASLVPSLVSTQRTRASGTALAQGDPERAVQLADDAIRAEPWAASPYAEKALALQAEGRLTEARDEINRAVDHESTNWRWLLIRAQIDGRAGNRSAALVDLVRARALAPRSPYLQPNSSFVRDVLGAQTSAQSQLGP